MRLVTHPMQAPQRKCVNGAAKAVRVCVDVCGGVVCVCVFLHVAEQTEARPALDVRGHLALTARTVHLQQAAGA